MTTQTETKLLTYMFALCLHIDGFATDSSLIAKDLSMSPQQCVYQSRSTGVFINHSCRVNNLFKSLGCKIESLSEGDLHRLGLPNTALQTKRAVLKTPLEFPTVRVKRARR